MKNKGAKQKLKRKGAASAFGCDLTEYLESSGQDGNVPPTPFCCCLRAMNFAWAVLDAVHKLMCSRLVLSLYFNRKKRKKEKKKYPVLNYNASTPQCRSWVCPSNVSQEQAVDEQWCSCGVYWPFLRLNPREGGSGLKL